MDKKGLRVYSADHIRTCLMNSAMDHKGRLVHGAITPNNLAFMVHKNKVTRLDVAKVFSQRIDP